MGRISRTFQNLKKRGETGLIPFLTAGDPDLGTTEELLRTLAAAGADIIELGVPFSDPMADGPVIQKASERALAGGASLRGILDLVARFRAESDIPIVLMGYFNPVFVFGIREFAIEAAQAGVDGVLLVDLPAEEREELHPDFKQAGIDLIQLIAPTTPPERTATLARNAEGFLYYVSMTGVTGSRRADPKKIREAVGALRAQSPVPVAVGFGIDSPEAAAEIGAFADAVVVGSALVKVIAEHGGSSELVPRVAEFVQALKRGLLGNESGAESP
jgi:tryptophan synthase alpha chain